MENRRLYGIDLIKTIAVFFVISVHFFLHSGYYSTELSLIPTFFRWLFFTCVPLFLLATGFLRYKKTVTKKYYLSLIPLYISYLLVAIPSSLMERNIFLSTLSVLSFKNGYSWYMEMFFGLSLIIPFINLSYNNIEKKLHKLILIGIMTFLTGICSLNLNIAVGDKNYYLLSDYWVILYPFTYYFIGAYIAEYKPKINKFIGTVSLFIIVLIEAVYTLLRCRGKMFNWALLGDYGGITVLISAVLIFLLLYDINIKNDIFRKLVVSISKKTLDIYLVSYLFDLTIYGILNKSVPDFYSRVKYAPIIILAVFFCSYIYAIIKEFIFKMIYPKKSGGKK